MDENFTNLTDETAAETLPAENTEKTDGEKKESSGGTFSQSLYEAVSVIVSSITIIAIVFTFAFRIIGVVGSSMEHTLSEGDYLIVTPYYTEPEYGDIVISSKETAAEGPLVKRVIAVDGDEVVVDETDTVFVNGEKRNDENYTIKDGRQHGNLVYPVTVPEDCVMLMGDNRCGSWDSRYSEIGFAETEYLLGKAQFRISFSNWNIYDNFND